jgi:uncharacterized protein YggE
LSLLCSADVMFTRFVRSSSRSFSRHLKEEPMIRTKAALAVAACLAGVVSGSLAAAQADTSSSGATGSTGSTGSTGAPATISVNGAGSMTVDSSASSATVQASYLTALGSALTDAHTKATQLSSAVGDTLGAVENITEQSNDGGPLCYGPMFAAAGTAKGAPVPAVSPGSPKKKTPHSSKPKKATAQIAAVTTSSSCTIEADITVTYAMSPA